MPRAKTKYGYSEPTSLAPELDEGFQKEIAKIISTDQKKLALFLDEIRLHLHRYRLRKQARTSLESGRPTQAQKISNAKDIKKTIQKLIEQLQGDAGGLKYHLHHGVYMSTNGFHGSIDTKRLITILYGVEYGCNDFLDILPDPDLPRFQEWKPSEKEEKLKNVSPLDRFAFDIAKSMRDILNERPTTNVYQGKNMGLNRDGKFAQVLKLCSAQVDGRVERDWRSLMGRSIKTLEKQ